MHIVPIPTRYIHTVQKSRAAQVARAMAAVVVATRLIRAEVAAVAAGADASVPLIVLKGRAGCDAWSLDLLVQVLAISMVINISHLLGGTKCARVQVKW